METNQTENQGGSPRGSGSEGKSAAEGKSTGGTIKQGLQEAGAAAKEGASKAAGQIKEKVAQKMERIEDQGQAYVEEQKGWLADRFYHCGEAARSAADTLREQNDPNFAHLADAIADRMEQVGDYVRERDVRDLLEDAQEFARRRPVLVYGGMFVLGFGLARFLRGARESEYAEEYGGAEGYGAEYPYQPLSSSAMPKAAQNKPQSSERSSASGSHPG